VFNTPILYIIFNRLDTVKQTFPRIKAQQPAQLFIAADGPRVNKLGEKEKCAEVREWVLSQIDWNCNVKTLFREENLGCGKNVSNAITWFFENIEQGIILEDDCLPNDSFFRYCEELLNKYKDNEKIFHISGDNPLQKCKCKNNASYYFAKLMHCWGWASWSRAFKKYCFDIDNNYQQVLETNTFFKKSDIKKQWKKILDDMLFHKIDTWDYQWSYKILELNAFCINPKVNLVQNIGMNSGAHYESSNSDSEGRQSFEMCFPLIHPKKIIFDMKKVYKIQTLGRNSLKDFIYRLRNLLLLPLKLLLKKIGLFDILKTKLRSNGMELDVKKDDVNRRIRENRRGVYSYRINNYKKISLCSSFHPSCKPGSKLDALFAEAC
jgi:hypothetical protein